MTFKKSGIGILIFLCLAYQLGVRKLLVCLATLVFGYFAAELSMKTNFSIPCMYKIVKKKLVRSKSCIIPPSVISHRRSSSSSSIQSTGSLESGSMHKKLKSKMSASLLAKDVNFETYFRHNHPWQSVYIPENVEKACEEVEQKIYTENIIKLFFYYYFLFAVSLTNNTEFYSGLVQSSLCRRWSNLRNKGDFSTHPSEHNNSLEASGCKLFRRLQT